MGIFRLEDNTPYVYTAESRDFQLFCRLFDAIQNGTKYVIDSLEYSSSNQFISTKLLQLAQTRSGFFPKTNIDATALRYLCISFPYILKYKGTEIGIKEAVRVFLKGLRISSPVSVNIVGKQYTSSSGWTTYDEDNSYQVRIGLQVSLKDMSVLNDILSYVIPTGYSIKYTTMADITEKDMLGMEDYVDYIFVSDNINSQVKRATGTYHNYKTGHVLNGSEISYGSKYSCSEEMPFRVLSQVAMTEVLSGKNAGNSAQIVLSEKGEIKNEN